MSATLTEHEQFIDSGGRPIVNGFVYYGVRNSDPVTNPVAVFSDRDLSIPLANPQRTNSTGRTVNKVWLAGSYSLKVENSNNVQLYQQLDNGTITDIQTTFAIVRLATTANIDIALDLSAGNAIDGAILVAGDTVLVKLQTNPAGNGIYVASSGGAALRVQNFAAYDDYPGVYFSVMQGTINADKLFQCESDRGGTIDVTALTITGILKTDGLIANGDIVATTGDITATIGDIVATTGDIVATTGNITATIGNITATNGDLLAPAGNVVADGDITATTGNITAANGSITAENGDLIALTGNITATGNIITTGGNLGVLAGNIIASGDITAESGDIKGPRAVVQSVHMPEGAAPATANAEGALYTKDVGGKPELFFRGEDGGSEVQITSDGRLKTAGALKSVQVFRLTGTWFRPAGITRIRVQLCAGGASGAGTTADGAGGGGAGGYVEDLIDVTGLSSQALTVGAGGAGVDATQNSTGNPGGETVFGPGLSAIGGIGAAGGDASIGGVGGGGFFGSIRFHGGAGSGAMGSDAGGSGGASYFGGGGSGARRAVSGGDALAPGSGSGGGTTQLTGNTGDGADGIIIVWEYG